MNGQYDDILRLPRPVSPRRHMTGAERAGQFAPFAALSGYEDAVRETARRTEKRIELSEEEQAALNERLRFLADISAIRPEATLTCFVPDGKKEGGSYVAVTGCVKRIDEALRLVILTGGRSIPIDDLLRVESAFFSGEIPDE